MCLWISVSVDRAWKIHVYIHTYVFTQLCPRLLLYLSVCCRLKSVSAHHSFQANTKGLILVFSLPCCSPFSSREKAGSHGPNTVTYVTNLSSHCPFLREDALSPFAGPPAPQQPSCPPPPGHYAPNPTALAWSYLSAFGRCCEGRERGIESMGDFDSTEYCT